MLTPVDIQQKKFKNGLGYDKKDVNTFFQEVSKSYEELYRSNADLKEKVLTLTDGLQHYKVTEESLQKSLLLAEKNTQESKTNAAREAKNIELEAKNRANEIVSQAYEQLEELEEKMKEIESRYAEYKSNFASLVKQQFELLDLKDFDPDAYIDPDYAVGGFAAAPSSHSSSGSSFGATFTDDPQMREGSTLGGASGSSSAESRREANRSSTTSVYGSTLGGSGIDPFGEGKSASPRQNVKKKQESSTRASSATVSANEDKEEEKPKAQSESTKAEKPSEAPKAAESNEEDSLVGDVQDKPASSKMMIDDNSSNPNEDSDGFEFV